MSTESVTSSANADCNGASRSNRPFYSGESRRKKQANAEANAATIRARDLPRGKSSTLSMSMKRRWLRTRRCSTRSSKIVWCQRWSALKANLTPRSTQASTHTCTTIIWLRQGRKKEKKYSLRGKKTLWGTPPKMRLSETSVVPSQLLAPSQNLESSTKSAIWEKLSSRTWLWITWVNMGSWRALLQIKMRIQPSYARLSDQVSLLST